MKQMTLNDMDSKRKRTEYGCRKTASKDGNFSPCISKETAERLTRYCELMNLNRTKFVEHCINLQLDEFEKRSLMAKSKEELVEMLLKGEKK